MQPKRPGPAKGRQAYVFYATDDIHALAVLVFVKLLRERGGSDRDIVLLHLPLAPALLCGIREAGIIPLATTAPRKLAHAYYRDCLVKLRAFEQLQYERIVYVDADAIPLRDLGVLFSIPLEAPLAAPLAYWLPRVCWTSCLLVIEPSLEASRRLASHIETRQDDQGFDMDIVNAAFAGEIQTLPAEYLSLDSEWEVADRPGYFADRPDILERLLVVHFSTLAKPWTLAPRAVRRLRPDADPAYYALRETWWDAMNEVIGGLPGTLRTRFRLRRLLRAGNPLFLWKARRSMVATQGSARGD